MHALELVSGFATAPSSTFTALTMAAGNTLTVRNAPVGSDIRLVQVWTDNQGAGTLRLRSPNFHDNVQGVRFDLTASNVWPLMPWGAFQPLFPQDTITAEITGSATGGDIETACFLVYYDNLPGAAANLQSWNEIYPRIVNIVTVENTLALGTAGGYSGEEAIDVEFDLLKANTEYALLGYMVDTECAAIRWRGADVSNYGVGGPGGDDIRYLTKDWFITLSDYLGVGCIPVFNAANKSGILIDGVQDENGADPTVTQIFAELAGPSYAPGGGGGGGGGGYDYRVPPGYKPPASPPGM